MAKRIARPTTLYKYMAFSERLIEQVCSSRVYFSDPSNFNDPLDCQPVVVADLETEELELLLARLVQARSMKEIAAALRRVRLKGLGATARKVAVSDSEARELIGEINHYATDPEVDDPNVYVRAALCRAIGTELRKAHHTGVLCLSSKYDSPLMWSHYADQHRGVCVGYDVSELPAVALHKVSYGESRSISAKDIQAWLVDGNELARRAIAIACLRTKAKEWRYENEWRLLGSVGLQDAGLHLRSITFGMRCKIELQYAIMKSLEGLSRKPKYFEMTQPDDRFQLKRRSVDASEVLAELPQDSIAGEFADLDAGGTN